jgi:septum site-determining protein MinD
MLAIAGGKGGCGKTTTAVGLAMAFARAGTRPLVADLDVDMPDLHTIAETPISPGLAALPGSSLDAVTHRSGRWPQVTVVPSGDTTPSNPSLDRLLQWPGPVLLDCPAGVSPAAADPLRAADRTLLVSTACRESLEDAAKTAAVARTLDAPPVGCILTRRTNSLPVENLLSCPLLGTVPEVRGAVFSAPRVRDSYSEIIPKIEGRKI